MSNKTKNNKGKKHLEKLFIGMDQGGTRFGGRPNDLLHLFLSGQIDLVTEVFAKDQPLEAKKALVISMANDVNKVLEEIENEKAMEKVNDNSDEDSDEPIDFQI